jgi:hypothetical protein
VWDVVAYYRGAIHVSMTLLGIPIFFGLLRLSKGWRTCALVIVWVAMIFTVAMFVSLFFVEAAGKVSVFGITLGDLSTWVAGLFSLALFLFYFWQYRVLTDPRVRALFYKSKAIHPSMLERGGSL